MKNFLVLLRYASNQKKQIALNILFNLIYILSSVFSLALIIPVLEFLFIPEKVVNTSIPEVSNTLSSWNIDSIKDSFVSWMTQIANQDKEMVLWLICLLLILGTVIKNIARYLALINIKILIYKSMEQLKAKVFNKLMNLPLSYFNHERKGDVMSRLSNDTKEIEWAMAASIEAIFKEPATILVYFAMLIFMSPILTLYILLILPVTAIVISILGKKLKAKSKESQEKQGALLSFFEEILGGIKIVKSFGAETIFKNKFDFINRESTRLNINVNKRVDLASPVSETLGISISAIILWIGGKMVYNNEIDASVFIGYFAIFSQLIPPFKQFSSAFYSVQKGVASANRIEEILHTDVEIHEKPNAIRISDLEKEISIQNVGFSYTDRQVLKNVSLTIPKGKKIALVGQSGSGKTTLTELIPRFYDVKSGSITIDHTDVKDLRIQDLRKLIGIVNQESILFNDSIRNNLLVGNPNASENELISALKMANAWEFVCQKEKGLDEIIGERGNKLSGGQKQRLSIARALLKNPQILILDEATSALDSESEKLVQEALNKLMQGRTTLVIAHRLSTILDADTIVVMENGEIKEIGSHEELIIQEGVYSKLYKMQFYGN
jgi:subfamily B ATP-binding cassette protein MsbA